MLPSLGHLSGVAELVESGRKGEPAGVDWGEGGV